MLPVRCTSLELLLLALVNKGVTTTYALREKAGLSVGVTSQALRRLKSAGLLTSRRGQRASQKFVLTLRGQKKLEEGWQYVVNEGDEVSLEAVLRILYLGWLFNQLDIASEYVMQASSELRFRAKQYEADAVGIRERLSCLGGSKPSEMQLSASEVAGVYRWIKSRTDATIARHQADALEAAVSEMKQASSPGEYRVGPALDRAEGTE